MKIGLVTGASGAIGRAIALQLAAEGYSLYLHYNSNSEGLGQLITELTNDYPSQFFKGIQANFFNQESLEQLIHSLPKEEIELVVHNSGHSAYGLFQDVTEVELERLLLHHVKTPFLITQALVPYMIRQKWGRVIVISSIWGQTGAAAEVTYSTVKGAQNSFCKALAKELAPSGITVNAIAPGAVQSTMLSSFNSQEIMAIEEDIPMGRLGKPDEVASLVRYLTRRDAGYITGQVLGVNGGWYC